MRGCQWKRWGGGSRCASAAVTQLENIHLLVWRPNLSLRRLHNHKMSIFSPMSSAPQISSLLCASIKNRPAWKWQALTQGGSRSEEPPPKHTSNTSSKMLCVTWLRVAEYSGLTGKKGTALRSVTSVLWFWVVSHTERNRMDIYKQDKYKQTNSDVVALRFQRVRIYPLPSRSVCVYVCVWPPASLPALLTIRIPVCHPSMLPLLLNNQERE